MLDYLIVYEHKVRELDNVCLLKAELERRGYTVELIQIGELRRLRYRFWRRPRVLVTYALYDDRSFAGDVTDIVGPVKKVVNLHWEQVLSRAGIKSGYHTPKGKAALCTHICWGRDAYERLMAGGVKNAVITGAIQMDFLRGSLRRAYLSREELEKRFQLPEGRMLLYISSFVYASMTQREIEAIERAAGTSMAQTVTMAREAREGTLAWLGRLLEEREDAYVVYRPHPGENIDESLEEMKRRYPRFRIISDGSVKQWILACDDALTWYSTAVAEVFYAGKSCHILRPVPVEKDVDVVMFDNARYITSYEELAAALAQREPVFPVPKENFEPYYGTLDGTPAYMCVAGLLEDVRNTEKYDIQGVRMGLCMGGQCKALCKRMIEALHITENTWPFSRIPRVRTWLSFFAHYREKALGEQASSAEIDALTARYRALVEEEWA